MAKKLKIKVSDLTLDEKLKLLIGKNMWQTEDLGGKLPSLFLSDGPSGLRKLKDPLKGDGDDSTVAATSFPAAVNIANSWDIEIAKNVGAAIAKECANHNVDILLAPGCNIKRTPLCGRNFEYFSEDPLVSGMMAKAFIEGVQENGIGTALKHFCLNNREYARSLQSSEADERTLYEIYLKPFEIALQAKPTSVMCSYNPINGVYASENEKFLNRILREKLGHKELIMSDWWAVHDRAKSVLATLDLEMPHTDASFDNLKAAYERGYITDKEINACVQRILELIEKTEENKKLRIAETDPSRNHYVALKAARESIVLLKNDGNILPLKRGKIAVIGTMSLNPPYGGGGSSLVKSVWPIPSLHDEIKAKSDAEVAFAWGYTHAGESLIEKNALRAAYENDIAVIVVGNRKNEETETYDRASLKLRPALEKLIIDTAKVNPNVVVVIEAGSAIDVSAWIDKVRAVMFAGFAGEAVNEALSDVLCGKYSPSGKLAETFPIRVEDTYCGLDSGNGFWERYADGVFVGYRYYDQNDIQVQFPFGHGLSYAAFEYTNLEVKKFSETEYEVFYTITNTSDVDASEVSQLYVTDVFSMASRPPKELKGFRKDFLKGGESKRMSIKLDKSAFAYYSTAYDAWYVENGWFEIKVGASSRDIRLSSRLLIELPHDTQQSKKSSITF